MATHPEDAPAPGESSPEPIPSQEEVDALRAGMAASGCSREAARVIAAAHFQVPLSNVDRIGDTVPPTVAERAYGLSDAQRQALRDCWAVSDPTAPTHVGAGWLIAIAKRDGRIVYAGSDHGE